MRTQQAAALFPEKWEVGQNYIKNLENGIVWIGEDRINCVRMLPFLYGSMSEKTYSKLLYWILDKCWFDVSKDWLIRMSCIVFGLFLIGLGTGMFQIMSMAFGGALAQAFITYKSKLRYRVEQLQKPVWDLEAETTENSHQ